LTVTPHPPFVSLGLFTVLVISIAFGLMIAFYISAEDSKKTNVVQTPVVKTQVQVPTVEDEILALEQIGCVPTIINIFDCYTPPSFC
jgi:hypothetical protein